MEKEFENPILNTENSEAVSVPTNTESSTDAIPTQKEGEEGHRPNYSVEIYFGVHGTAEDTKGVEGSTPKASVENFSRASLAESFHRADIYIPELHGWDDLSLNQFNDLAYGRVTPDELLAEIQSRLRLRSVDPNDELFGMNIDIQNDPMIGFRKAEMEIVYKSFKPVIILDIPHDHPKIGGLRGHGKSKLEISGREPFEKILASIKGHQREVVDLQNHREDYMLSQLTPRIEEIFEKRPDLKEKKDLKILMFLGAVHTRMAHMMSRYNIRIESRHSRLPQIYTFSDEIHRRLSFGKEVSNDLAAKSFLESEFYNLLASIAKEFTDDNNEVSAFVRRIISSFTYEEIKKIFEMGPQMATTEFFNHLDKKKIKPPLNHTDLVSFISNK